MLPQAILDFMTPYNQTAKPLEWSHMVEQLERKLALRLSRTHLPKPQRTRQQFITEFLASLMGRVSKPP